MEANLRWTLVAAVAPISWGATYFVTQRFLPADYPLYGAALRALPAGLFLLALRRTPPHGSWWWKSAALGVCNFGAFFALVYLAAQLLASSVAATIMATSPLVMMLLAWLLISERLRLLPVAGAVVGLIGVCLMLLTGTQAVEPLGVLASFAAMSMSSVGYVLAKRWNTDVDVLASTSWQLIAGGLVVLPFAVAAEGSPPALHGTELAGFAFVSFIATAVAFAAWFTGLRHLSAGTVGLVGLLNPATGVLLGTLLAAELLSAQQVLGLTLVLVGVLLGQPALTRRLSARDWATRAAQRAETP